MKELNKDKWLWYTGKMSKEDMETLGVFQEIINKENTEVVDLYKAAKKGKPISSDTDAEKVIDEVSDPIKTLSA